MQMAEVGGHFPQGGKKLLLERGHEIGGQEKEGIPPIRNQDSGLSGGIRDSQPPKNNSSPYRVGPTTKKRTFKPQFWL